MQTTRPHVTWKVFTNDSNLPILKIFDQNCEKICWAMNCLFWTKTSQRLIYIYYPNTDNIHIVLENDNTVLTKDLKRL